MIRTTTMNVIKTLGAILASGGALGGIASMSPIQQNKQEQAQSPLQQTKLMLASDETPGQGDGPAIASRRDREERSRPVHPQPAADPSYIEAIHRTAEMVSDTHAQRLAQQHGLHILNLTWEDTGRYKNSAVGPNISDMTIQVAARERGNRGLSITSMPVIRYPNFLRPLLRPGPARLHHPGRQPARQFLEANFAVRLPDRSRPPISPTRAPGARRKRRFSPHATRRFW